MPHYKVFRFDGGHIVSAERLTAADDSDAIANARQRISGDVGELWRGPTRVITFDPHRVSPVGQDYHRHHGR